MIKKLIGKILTREIIMYLIFGVLTTLVGLGSYELVFLFKPVIFGSEALLPQIISVTLAITFAFFVNKIFVFESKNWDKKTVWREAATFSVGRLAISGAETVLLVWLVDALGLHKSFSKIFTLCLVMISNYVVSKFAVFIKKGDEKKEDKE
ncbi:MAG: GtrA family protein [Defluviitaleaceae bacterium]|nr:GtrA family protein [Defluviitaleaceae bacterium]